MVRGQESGFPHRVALSVGISSYPFRLVTAPGPQQEARVIALAAEMAQVFEQEEIFVLAQPVWRLKHAAFDCASPHAGQPLIAPKEDDMQDIDPLTKREWEVLHLVGQGCRNRQIAEALVIEVVTVQNHLRSIFDKLRVTSRIQAVLRANMLVSTGQATDRR